MSYVTPFSIGGPTTPVTNAVAATAQFLLPASCDALVLYNSSATATNFIRVTNYTGSPPADAAGNAPTVTTDFPVPPTAQIRLYVGPGAKFIRTIASAADGTTYITPGSGI